MTSVARGPSEEDPLLPRVQEVEEQKVTPLPKLQLTILLLIQIAEPVSSQVIYPFINQVRVFFVLLNKDS